MKDPKRLKNILKGKADLLQKSDQNIFRKKFESHVFEIERSKKTNVRGFFSLEILALLLLLKRSFGHAPSLNSNRLYGGA